jgi:hypothetical protein
MYYMSDVDNVTVALADNYTFDHFRKVITQELHRLGPHPRNPLTVKKAAEISRVSQNTAGKYIDIMAMKGEIEIVKNLPRKDIYLSCYSNENKGRGDESV